MIVLGRVAAPFGIKGWIKVQPFGDDAPPLEQMPRWWLSPDADAPAERWAQYALRTCQTHGKGLIASIEGVIDRNAAEALSGWYVAAPREALPRTQKDEYYWDDLIGLAVVDEQGGPLGEVTGLMSTGAHDVLQVKDGDLERLIPFVSAYVLEVDLAARSLRAAWQKDW